MALVEILHPDRDHQRISELRTREHLQVVDLWSHAADELRTLDALAQIDPDAGPITDCDLTDEQNIERCSRWVYFPWRNTVVRMPEESIHYRLRTARNRFLLTGAEQISWQQATVAVAGLSVGSSVLTACSLTGAQRFHIADPDVVAPTNLNRMVASVCDTGKSKLSLAAQRILEADPYSQITEFPEGYTAENSEAFLGITSGDQVTIAVEEIDDVAMKIDLRRRARAAGIPVVSATDMGENVILDVERYDLDSKYPILHGLGEGFHSGDDADPRQRLAMAAAIVGSELTPRMAFSAAQLGRAVSSWPQLGSTAMIAGGFAAAAARNIVSGRDIQSGRYRINTEETLFGTDATASPGWNEFTANQIQEMLTAMGIATESTI